MCLKKIFEKSSEKIADITFRAGKITDLIMISLMANHSCTSISFDTAEYDDEQIEKINKYKRSINRLYKKSFIIRHNEILIKSDNLKNLKAFIKNQILSAIPPPDYDYANIEDFIKRFTSYESYTDEVLKLFDFFTEQIFKLQAFNLLIEHQLQIYKMKNLITYKNCRGWQKIFTELVFNKLHPESVVTNYFVNAEVIKNNLCLFNFNGRNISLIKVENNEIKINNAYENNQLVLLPYLMCYITNSAPIEFQMQLIYSCLCLLP